ncbi:hypothetical protein B9Z55_021605 [Caenorhabditis nigoni]|uniref:F-box domain-containing protein n=1 Tax=Caenorhabditis nigoni TaxID=1611254 RepID=A0A2G5TST0_9PELO|nr:hypothetical protein B9Z55_021605 [Caenorhabditis nigoni]
MPIRLLSLPSKDLQYAINSMDLGDVIALSLCSNRTKNLVKDSKRRIEPIHAEVYGNRIRFNISDFQELQNDWDQDDLDLGDGVDNEFISLDLFDSLINIHRANEIEVWRRPEFAQCDWIVHLLSIFNESMIPRLRISDSCPIEYMNTIKQIIPKCNSLEIIRPCSNDVARKAFLKLAPIAEEVNFEINIFDNDNDISKFLTLNLNSVNFIDFESPFKLELSDLLVSNIDHLSIRIVNITDKELNRFAKLWMKGSHKFYRPKLITLVLKREMDINKEEVLKGIQYEFVEESTHQYRIRRGDGKELSIRIFAYIVDFEFE